MKLENLDKALELKAALKRAEEIQQAFSIIANKNQTSMVLTTYGTTDIFRFDEISGETCRLIKAMIYSDLELNRINILKQIQDL